MKILKSVGTIVFTKGFRKKFLLLKHPTRFDIPKGLIGETETELECALRVLNDETGIEAHEVTYESGFKFSTEYQTRARKLNNQLVHKHLIIYLAFVNEPKNIKLAEHIGFEWMSWAPPHSIQMNTIDPLLNEIDKYLSRKQELTILGCL